MSLASFPFEKPKCTCKPMDYSKHVSISNTMSQCTVCKEKWAYPHNEHNGRYVMF